jgi:NAD+ kinase
LKKRVGILFQPKIEAARELADSLTSALSDSGASVWVCSAWDADKAAELADGTDMVICLGGDGTVLRAARIACPRGIPVLGVNLGRVGFMTELRAEEALSRVPGFVDGQGRVEERATIQAEVVGGEGSILYALNDVVVARGERCRLIRVQAFVDGEEIAKYKCDAVVLATATGSTGYSLAAGGPILHPLSGDIVLQPVAAHLSPSTPLVLPPDVTVELRVDSKHYATLSVDGQVEVPLQDGAVVRVKRSPHMAKMLRSEHSVSFYGTLIDRLAKGD